MAVHTSGTEGIGGVGPHGLTAHLIPVQPQLAKEESYRLYCRRQTEKEVPMPETAH